MPESPNASRRGLRVCTQCAGGLPHACQAPSWCACVYCEHPANPLRDMVLDVVRKHLQSRTAERKRAKREAS
jgi:hypothetical protein